jgi:hypothetical protein
VRYPDADADAGQRQQAAVGSESRVAGFLLMIQKQVFP